MESVYLIAKSEFLYMKSNKQKWVERTVSMESWNPNESRQIAQSAIDITRIVFESLDALLDLKV